MLVGPLYKPPDWRPREPGPIVSPSGVGGLLSSRLMMTEPVNPSVQSSTSGDEAPG
jgi:hypothetical protein